ncbi:MAG: class I SAM-dependent methyltransferase [Sphingomonas sp.]|uniref:class I SAM-dependent methyltransferase n=1 Tax=Sphingomonas sp. TaxID=28214 RepID=UPI0017A9FE1F|nr:methyltransferase [Sphingomonas sp.]MBA3668227.1 class I SAM-dependent methyltransferase [Sphingomonas sp.]
MRTKLLAALFLAMAVPANAAPVPANIKASVAATAARSEANVKLDESRKPAEVLAFLGLKPGIRVSDPFGGNLYWTEITAPVVGPKGRVTIWEPQQSYKQKTYDRFTAFKARQPNVWMRVSRFESPDLPAAAYDFMLINLDYHDVYWVSAKDDVVKIDPDAWLKVIYGSMKRGAVVGVIDHVGNPGDTRDTAQKLHRIDPETVKADFKRAGFKLVAESDMLRNTADDHSLPVFDPNIRGKTDRFLLKFRKP